MQRAFTGPGISLQGLIKVENPVAHTRGEILKGVVDGGVVGTEGEPNNMVIGDNRLQNPAKPGIKEPSASQIQD